MVVIDLLDSSEDEETTTKVALGGSNYEDAVCVDSGNDEDTNEWPPSPQRKEHRPAPMENEVIEIDDSSDEEAAVVVQKQSVAATLPSQAASLPTSITPLDDSDFDSSDDERDLSWHRQKMKRLDMNGSQSHVDAESAPVSQPEVQPKMNKKIFAAMERLPDKGPEQKSQGEPRALSVAVDKDSIILSNGQLQRKKTQSEQALRVEANMRQTSRSPRGTNIFSGKPRTPTSPRRLFPETSGKQDTMGMWSSNGKVQNSDKASVAVRPNTLVAGDSNVSRRPKPNGGIFATALARQENESRSDASLMASQPVFGKWPLNDNGDMTLQTKKVICTQQKLPSNGVNLSSVQRKRPIGKGPKNLDRKPSPRKLPAVNAVKALVPPVKTDKRNAKQQPSMAANKHRNVFPSRTSAPPDAPVITLLASRKLQSSKCAPGKSRLPKFAFGASSRSLKKSKTRPLPPDDNDLVVLGRKGNRYSALNERLRKGVMNRSPPPKPSPLKSIIFSRSIPTPQRAYQRKNLTGQPRMSDSAWTSKQSPTLKQASPLASQKIKLTGKTGRNESDGTQTKTRSNENVSLLPSTPILPLKRASPLNESGGTRPKKQLKQQPSESSNVDRGVFPTGLNERPDIRPASLSDTQPKPLDQRSDITGKMASSLPGDEEVFGQDLSSRGSVVSPTDDGDNFFARVPVATRTLQASTNFEPSTHSTNDTFSRAENVKILPPFTQNSKQPKDSGVEPSTLSKHEPIVSLTPSHNPDRLKDSSGIVRQDSVSSEFSKPSDSDSEMTGTGIVANSEPLLHAILPDDDGQRLWSRNTANPVDYREPGDDVEMTNSQSYLQDSTPATRHTDKASKSSEADPSDPSTKSEDRLSSQRRTSKRKRDVPYGGYSDSARRREPLDEHVDKGDDVVKECAAPIEHLSRYTYDQNGLPTHEFSVLDADDTIYDLKIQVKESGIPGAGLGAFLTFHGARVLTDELRGPAAKKREDLVLYEPETMEPLEAVSPDGYGIAVSLTGKNLHDNHNLSFWAATAIPHEADTATGLEKKSVNMKLRGEFLCCDDSDDEEEPLGFSMCPKRVGHLGIHTENDYVSDPTIELNSVDFSVELGRYGPVLKSDRKREPDHDVKNYAFSDAPAEYGFGVNEKIAGCNQVIDITDDATGTRHEAALRLPMSYINETGHSPYLKSNVQIREKNDRSVYYYLTLPEALKKGQTIELLANYGTSYESVRERKGYGKANVDNGVRSDDHEPTALKRNFEERQFITDLIDGLNTVAILHLTEFIVSNMLKPLDKLIGKYLRANGASTQGNPTALQWVARHRLSWIADIISHRIPSLVEEPSLELPPETHDNLINQVNKWAQQMKWQGLSECVDVLADRDAKACEALRAASRADILYKLSETIVKPLDEDMWCPVAVELIKNLCDDTALYLSSKNENRDVILIRSYLRRAKESKDMIGAACREQTDFEAAMSKLKFVSNVAKDEIVDEAAVTSFEGFKEPDFFQKNTTFPKGILASLLELQTYRDAMELACLPEQSRLKLVPQHDSLSREVVIVEGSYGETSEAREAGVAGYPQDLDSVVKGGHVNNEWYMLWQVVYVVVSFAEEFSGKSRNGEKRLSLKRLCSHIGVDLAKAQAVIDQGIDRREYSVTFEGQKAKSRTKKRAPQQHVPRQAAPKGPRDPSINKSLFDGVIWKALVGLGWTLDVGTRPTDNYFLPPGVERRRGFSNRKDYFDSVKLVMNFIKTDSRWKDRAEVAAAVDLFDKLDKFKSTMKLSKKIDVDWLIRQYEESSS